MDGATCSSTPPSAALCVAGAARAFASPLVLSALKSNLVDAIDAKLSIFVQLKTSDSAKALGPNRMAFDVHRTSIASIRAALRQQWLASRIEESVIINGSGSYLGDGAIGLSASRPPVVMANASGWRAHRARHCKLSNRTYLAAGNNEERMILHHLGLQWCRGAVLRAEARRGNLFDLVGYVRPDLVWWKPIRKWCDWFAPSSRTMLSCNRTGCDMAWFAPRAYMMPLLGQAELHRDCTIPSRCCSTPERLLQHAKRVALCRARAHAYAESARAKEEGGLLLALPPPPLSATALARLRDCVHAEHPAPPQEVDLFSERPPIATIVRDAAACPIALTGAAEQQQQQQGVSAATAEWLRTRFGGESKPVAACEKAFIGSGSAASHIAYRLQL